jgi:hypothetical protein
LEQGHRITLWQSWVAVQLDSYSGCLCSRGCSPGTSFIEADLYFRTGSIIFLRGSNIWHSVLGGTWQREPGY